MCVQTGERGRYSLTKNGKGSRVCLVQESEQVQMQLPFTESEVAALQEAREVAIQAAAAEREGRRSRTVKQGRRSRVQEEPCRMGDGLRLISGVEKICKLVPLEVQKKPLDYDELPLDEARDVSERLEFEGMYFRKTRYHHPRFLRKEADENAYFVTCRLPECILGNSALGDSLLVHAICNKFCERLPMYRQLKFFSDHGLIGVSEEMLNGWMRKVAEVLTPLYEFFYCELQEKDSLQIYEAPTSDIRDKRPIGHMSATRDAETGRVHYRWREELSVAVPEKGEVLSSPPLMRESLFISAPGEGEMSALFYTFMEECERCGLVFGEWLLRTLQALPGHRGSLAGLLPEMPPAEIEEPAAAGAGQADEINSPE